METIDKLKSDLKALNDKITLIKEKINKKKSQTLVRCESNNYGDGCGMGFQINELVYEQTQWYERPHGCTGGDMWHNGEGQWKCPNCEHTNRLYDKPEIEELKYLFKEVKVV